MNEWMNGWMNERREKWTHVSTNEWENILVDEWIVNERMNMSGWFKMNKWVKE